MSVEETSGGLSQRFFHMLATRTGMAAADGARSQLRAATDPAAKSGEFYGPAFFNNGPPVRKPVLRRVGMDTAIARLWEVSERETGIRRAGAPSGRQDGDRRRLVSRMGLAPTGVPAHVVPGL